MILYINNEHCSSVEQLKGYFRETLTHDSDIYADLLDYGRYGDIAAWLREMNEPVLAEKVESISTDLGDHAFYAQLKTAITGEEAQDAESLKPAFDKCFSFENMTCDMMDKEANVTVIFKILMCVNEEFLILVSCNWGTKALNINPNSYKDGENALLNFVFHKRQSKDIGNISLKADGIEIASISVNTSDEKLIPVNQNLLDPTISAAHLAVQSAITKIALAIQSAKDQKILFTNENDACEKSVSSKYTPNNEGAFDCEAYMEASERAKYEYAKRREQERIKQEEAASIRKWRDKHGL